MPAHKKALTLIEIIISVLILALVSTGLVNVFITSKNFVQHTRYRMSAAEIGKKFLDPLQYYVRGDTWDDAASNCFTSGDITQCPNVSTTISPYSATYTISNLGDDANLKKVTVKISWTE